jgi:CheY-like chemotaxis protein
VPSQNLFIDADRHVLSKIFNNLINNALKFTLNGGVTISADVIVDGKELLIKTDVTDTGIGIPEKYQRLIFEPFRQASEGLSRNYTGTGLGLTLTRKFIELINGSISVESTEGSGSTFSVTLPFSKSGEQFSGQSDIIQSSAKLRLDTKPSLLLVEDDLVNAQIVIAYLRPFFEIDHVEDGQSGIDLCKAKTYDTVLMDIALKGINGTVTMQEIKKLNEHYIQIPFVAITAYAMLGDKESFLSAGFSYYISKPFTRTQLFEVLTHIFGNGKN